MGNSFTMPSALNATLQSTTTTTYQTINFEDVQSILYDNETLLINTLEATQQQCLIVGTVPVEKETAIMNIQLTKNKKTRIVVYGMNSSDISILKKYEQLQHLGFSNVFLYLGGLFEWLLLQDIYSAKLFPTTTHERDILKYKGRPQFNLRLLTNS